MIRPKTAGRILTGATVLGATVWTAETFGALDDLPGRDQVEQVIRPRNSTGAIVEEFGPVGTLQQRVRFQSVAATTALT